MLRIVWKSTFCSTLHNSYLLVVNCTLFDIWTAHHMIIMLISQFETRVWIALSLFPKFFKFLLNLITIVAQFSGLIPHFINIVIELSIQVIILLSHTRHLFLIVVHEVQYFGKSLLMNVISMLRRQLGSLWLLKIAIIQRW